MPRWLQLRPGPRRKLPPWPLPAPLRDPKRGRHPPCPQPLSTLNRALTAQCTIVWVPSCTRTLPSNTTPTTAATLPCGRATAAYTKSSAAWGQTPVTAWFYPEEGWRRMAQWSLYNTYSHIKSSPPRDSAFQPGTSDLTLNLTKLQGFWKMNNLTLTISAILFF